MIVLVCGGRDYRNKANLFSFLGRTEVECEACDEDEAPICEGCGCCQECCNCTPTDCDCEACISRRENEE